MACVRSWPPQLAWPRPKTPLQRQWPSPWLGHAAHLLGESRQDQGRLVQIPISAIGLKPPAALETIIPETVGHFTDMQAD